MEAARQGGAEALFVETPEAAGEWLREHLEAGDAVLLKAFARRAAGAGARRFCGSRKKTVGTQGGAR